MIMNLFECLYYSEDIRENMYPTTCDYMVYVRHQELTKDDRHDALRIREDFERTFLPLGAKLMPRSEMKE